MQNSILKNAVWQSTTNKAHIHRLPAAETIESFFSIPSLPIIRELNFNQNKHTDVAHI